MKFSGPFVTLRAGFPWVGRMAACLLAFLVTFLLSFQSYVAAAEERTDGKKAGNPAAASSEIRADGKKADNPAAAATEKSAADEKLTVDEQVASMNFADAPVVVAVIDGNQSRFYTYGHAHAGSNDKPDENTLFRIASISKVFTGLVLADLVHRGDLNLNDTAEKYLPGANLPRFQNQPFTLKQLATHTSGLPRRVVQDASVLTRPFKSEDLLASLARTKIESLPGSNYTYSNLGVAVLGEVLSAREKMSFEDLLQECVCKPLHLVDTSSLLPAGKENRLAQSYDRGRPARAIYPSPAAAGLYSSGADLARLIGAYLNPDETDIPDTLKISCRPLAVLPSKGQIAMCWHILPRFDLICKDGSLPGFKSFIGFIPGQKKGVVVLAGCSKFQPRRLGMSILHCATADAAAAEETGE